MCVIGLIPSDTGEQATSTEGNPLPPTDKPGETWRLNTPAHHKDN
jgi:hypothetical protein